MFSKLIPSLIILFCANISYAEVDDEINTETESGVVVEAEIITSENNSNELSETLIRDRLYIPEIDCSLNYSLLEKAICYDPDIKSNYELMYQEKQTLQKYVFNEIGKEAHRAFTIDYMNWRKRVDTTCELLFSDMEPNACINREITAFYDLLSYYNTVILDEYFPLSAIYAWHYPIDRNCEGSLGTILLDETDGYVASRKNAYSCQEKELHAQLRFEGYFNVDLKSITTTSKANTINSIYAYNAKNGYFTSSVDLHFGMNTCVVPFMEKFITTDITMNGLYEYFEGLRNVNYYDPTYNINDYANLQFALSNYEKYEFLIGSIMSSQENFTEADLFPYSKVVYDIEEYLSVDPLPFSIEPIKECLDRIQSIQ